MKIAIINKLTPEHPAWKHGKRLDVKIFTQLWNPPAEWNGNTLKERTPLHRWQADAIYNELVASAVKKVKNAKSPMGRWIASEELTKKIAELNSRPIL